MAGAAITFDLDDLKVLSDLDQIAAAGEDMFPLMDAIGRVLVNGAVERITVTNIDPDGIAWPQSFRAEVFGGPTLHATGHLARSITSAPESREVTVGSNLIYAGVHQDGAIIRAKTAGGLLFMLAEIAGDNRYASDDMIEQPVTGRIGVIMAVRDIADRTGARASIDLLPLREAVMLGLCRFIHPGADQAFRFSRGQLISGVDAKGGQFWQDEYTLRFDRRIPLT